MFCGKCGTQVPDDNKFCSNCGSPMGDTAPSQATTEVPQNTNQEKDKEKVYYKGEGELLVRTTKHHGAGRKAASFIVGMGVGYLVAGRDSKRTSKAKGTMDSTVVKAVIKIGRKRLVAPSIIASFLDNPLACKIFI